MMTGEYSTRDIAVRSIPADVKRYGASIAAQLAAFETGLAELEAELDQLARWENEGGRLAS